MVWKDHGEMKLIIEKEPFDKGNFRNAFKAIECNRFCVMLGFESLKNDVTEN